MSNPDGLIEFTLDDKQFHRADGLNEIADLNDFSSPGGVNVDLQGRVWWNSVPKGIIIYEPPTRSYVSLFTNPRRQQASAFPCYHIYCDRDGMVWTSGWYAPTGIYQIIPASLPVFRYWDDPSQAHLLSDEHITNVLKVDHGKLWIGQGDKLTIFDPQTGFFQLFCSGKDLPPFEGMPTTHSTPIQVDTIHQKALFTITNDQPGIGLIQMDILTKHCRPVIFKDSADQVMADPPKDYNIVPFKNNAILVSDNGSGIYMVNTENGLAHWIAPGVKRSSGLRTDNDHLLFIRKPVTNLTYSFLDGKWKRIASPLDSIAWVGGAIYYNEKDKTYWAGDFNQLIHYDKDFRVIYQYTQEDGLRTEDISIVLSDDQDNIWIQTIRSISKLNIKTGKIILLSEKDGLKKQLYGPNAPVEASGVLYFWGDNGIDRVSPDKLAESYPPSFVYFKSMEIKQKKIPLPTGINDVQELSLRYFQNKITIETGIIDYHARGGSRIRYKLENVNENWQVAPANYTIRYDGLPPGKYWLVVQASNAANDFSGPEKRLLIHIYPPFWQTWWFYFLSAIILAAAIYALFRYRLMQKIKLFEMRNRISQDLHDEIGASISGINLLSQIAAERLQDDKPKEAAEYLFKVKNYSQDVIEKLSDMVWVFNPQNDSIEKLLLRLRSFAISLAASKNIKLRFETNKGSESVTLTIRQRKTIYLISKEAMNNIFKYADCNNIYYNLSTNGSKWRLTIKDDGLGFIPAENKSGNGLKNMQARADEIGARFNIQSQPGTGTIISVEV